MNRSRLSILSILVLVWANLVSAQDVLRADRIKSLHGLTAIKLVARPRMDLEVITMREFFDHVSVLLHQKIPPLKEQEDANAWLIVEYITTVRGGLVAVSVYRWAMVSGAQAMSFVKVWDDHKLILGGGGDIPAYKHMIKDITEEIITSLAADYYRANP